MTKEKKVNAPVYEPGVKTIGKIIMVVSIFLPFTLLISIGDSEQFLTIVFLAIPTIVSVYIYREPVSIITSVIMILFTLYLK